jgi:hypothetical protein
MFVKVSIYEDMCWVAFELNESGTDGRKKDKKRGEATFRAGRAVGCGFGMEETVSVLR